MVNSPPVSLGCVYSLLVRAALKVKTRFVAFKARMGMRQYILIVSTHFQLLHNFATVFLRHHSCRTDLLLLDQDPALGIVAVGQPARAPLAVKAPASSSSDGSAADQLI